MSNRRIKAVIDLNAIRNNVEFLYNHINKQSKIMCVIKANGYGHGAVKLAKVYEEIDFVCGYATATAEEALELRNNGIKKKILILGATFPEDYETLVRNNISLAIFTIDSAIKLNEISKNIGLSANVHIKVDTGMSRIGVNPLEDGLEIVKTINSLDNINIEGIFTHFARADEVDKKRAFMQLELFNDFTNRIKEIGINIPIKHCANSASILELPDTRFDMVRAGIVLYGLWPSDEIIKEGVNLMPAMSLVSHISHIKKIKKGTQISYGGTFEAKEDMIVATIPVGYADGYPRMLSNCGKVLINGKFAPILGRVCMDQFMADVSLIDNVNIGAEVVLMGTQGDEKITAEDIGDLSKRFNYELVCDITSRVPREYINE